MFRCTFLACVALSALACDSDVTSGGGGSGGSGTGGDGATGGSGAGNSSDCVPHTTSADPDFTSPTGRFSLRVEETFADFSGRVFDAAPGGFHTEIERSGSCRLLGYETTNCSPDCDFGDFCVDSACVASPSILDAGSLVLTGVAPSPVEVAASDNIYYWSAEPAPNLAPVVTLTNEGGDVGAIDLSVCVPPALEPSSDWTQALEDRAPGESVTLTWSDPVPYARIYLRMTTGIGTHGGISPIEVECEGPDVGTLEIPGSYLDQLFADGWSCGECGNNDLRRYVADQGAVSSGTARFTAETWSTFFFHP